MSSESKQLEQLSHLIDLCSSMGMILGYDNSGQIVLYTGVTHFIRSPEGDYTDADGIAFLTDAAVQACDFRVSKS